MAHSRVSAGALALGAGWGQLELSSDEQLLVAEFVSGRVRRLKHWRTKKQMKVRIRPLRQVRSDVSGTNAARRLVWGPGLGQGTAGRCRPVADRVFRL